MFVILIKRTVYCTCPKVTLNWWCKKANFDAWSHELKWAKLRRSGLNNNVSYTSQFRSGTNLKKICLNSNTSPFPSTSPWRKESNNTHDNVCLRCLTKFKSLHYILILQCLVPTKRSYILQQPSAESYRFV